MSNAPRAVDIKAALAGRPVSRDGTPHTSKADAEATSATLAPFRDGGVFAGSFSGESPWERHVNGDELVHILDGATTLTIISMSSPGSTKCAAQCWWWFPRAAGTAFNPGTA